MSERRSAAEPPAFDLRVEHGGAATLVLATGEMDLATAAEFEASVRRELAAGPVRLDLSGLTFMDSSGVRALDALLRDPPGGNALVIAPDLQPGVRQILTMTGMIDVLPFEPLGERS